MADVPPNAYIPAEPPQPNPAAVPAELIEDFVGSTQMFCLALTGVMEDRLLQAVAQGQLTAAQMKVLRLIAQAGNHTVGDLASLLGISNAAASKIVERLVRRKFLRRSESLGDRRSSDLSVTVAGRQVLADYQGLRMRQMLEIFRQFSAEQLTSASELFSNLTAALATHGAEAGQMCLQCAVYFRERCLLKEMVRRDCPYQRRKSLAATGRRALMQPPSASDAAAGE